MYMWKVGFSLEGESETVTKAEVERQVRRVLARGGEMDAVHGVAGSLRAGRAGRRKLAAERR